MAVLATLYCHGRSSYWKLNYALRSLDRCDVRNSSSDVLARSCRDWNVLARKSHCAALPFVCRNPLPYMPALGQKQTCAVQKGMSALPQKRTYAVQKEM